MASVEHTESIRTIKPLSSCFQSLRAKSPLVSDRIIGKCCVVYQHSRFLSPLDPEVLMGAILGPGTLQGRLRCA